MRERPSRFGTTPPRSADDKHRAFGMPEQRMPGGPDEPRQLIGLGGADHRELDALVAHLQEAGDREVRRDRIDADLRMTLPPLLNPSLEGAIRMLGELLRSPSQDEHGRSAQVRL